MRTSGFVLAGGRSSRMGVDKALLPYQGTSLLAHVAGVVRQVTASVAFIGDPSKYGHLGYAVYRDRLPSCGPMGGIHTALMESSTPWNLIVACDMPALDPGILRLLVETAGRSPAANCIIASRPDGDLEPLCAIYHKRATPLIRQAIERKLLKLKDLIPELKPTKLPVDVHSVLNVNTPADWAEFREMPK